MTYAVSSRFSYYAFVECKINLKVGDEILEVMSVGKQSHGRLKGRIIQK
jgi:hypothetical protein